MNPISTSPLSTPRPAAAGGVLLATLLLPGLAVLGALSAAPAQAESAPEKTTVAVKYGHYEDSQSGWNRVKVDAPQVYVQAPLAGDWALEASGVSDDVSGASPRMHTQRASASVMHDERKAGDLKVTRYLARAAVSASVAYSHEHDYDSRALGLDARWSSDDNNRSWTLGYGHTSDKIDNQASGINTAINRHKSVNELMAGVTQVLTPTDIAQLNLTRSVGNGYYNDPYKLFDQRPDSRNAWIGLARWNHHIDLFDASLRSSYRLYRDTFGVRSHTVGLDWAQPVGRWTVTPGVRYYSQSAASFYFDPVLDAQGRYDDLATFTHAASLPGDKSADQRLAAYGAVTLSLKLSYAVTRDTVADIRLDTYRQAASLRAGGQGSPNLDALRATFVQLGLSHRF